MSNKEYEHIKSVGDTIFVGFCVGMLFLLISAFIISFICISNKEKNAKQEKVMEEARIASVF